MNVKIGISKIGNWNFEELFKDENFKNKIIIIIIIIINKCENWNFRIWKSEF